MEVPEPIQSFGTFYTTFCIPQSSQKFEPSFIDPNVMTNDKEGSWIGWKCDGGRDRWPDSKSYALDIARRCCESLYQDWCIMFLHSFQFGEEAVEMISVLWSATFDASGELLATSSERCCYREEMPPKSAFTPYFQQTSCIKSHPLLRQIVFALVLTIASQSILRTWGEAFLGTVKIS
eukprot:705638-Amphidinium_carterae.4